jgi:DNA (cytosine-5)-methyltransferase 1
MSNPKIGSLFSGAGMLDLAVEKVLGGDTVWQCEFDPSASKVLARRFPDVPNLGDITAIDWAKVEPIDILCGGFPCQDVSSAGRRAGIAAGTRSGLWSYFADAIAALRPQLVVIENVRGLLSAKAIRSSAMESDNADLGVLRAAGAVLGDLADIGYDAQWTTVAASSVGAPHKRERVLILATPDATRGPGSIGDGNDVRPWGSSGRHAQSAGAGSDAVALLPTPTQSDGTGGGMAASPKLSWDGTTQSTGDGGNSRLRDVVGLLTPAAQWGKYAAAIHRWEAITRPAPAPTEPNTKGNPRLDPAFSEWIMGWPAGWVSGLRNDDRKRGPHEISRNEALRIIGNGVVPQQAEAALQLLLAVDPGRYCPIPEGVRTPDIEAAQDEECAS